MQAAGRGSAGPFTGIRIVELCRGVAGPFAGMLLADLGADVVKLEEAGGDPLRGHHSFHVLNRSKRSVVLEDGPDGALALLARADALLVDRDLRLAANGRLDAETLRARLPQLVHCSVSGLGETGELRDLPADDGLAAALSAISAHQWSHGGGAIYLTTPLTAYACGMTAALAIASALHARTAGHGGQSIAVSQLGGAMLFQSGTYVAGQNYAGSLTQAANDPHGIFPTYSFYRASDDWLFIGALTETFWVKLCNAIERVDLLAHPELQGTPLSYVKPDERRRFVRRTLEEVIAARPREEWLERLRANDVPCGPVVDRLSFLHDEQTRASDMCIEVDDPLLGRTEQMGIPIRFARTPGAVRGPAPRLGEHGHRVPSDWSALPSATTSAPAAPRARPRSFSDDPGDARNLERARLAPAALDGVRVVNLATFIAGALCPMLLADLGAEVIKVEPLEGDPFRVGTTYGFLGWNRGMRSLAVDLRREEGQQIFRELVRRADVVVDNYRAGVLERLGIDYPKLRALNPGVIHTSITGYGPSGPLAQHPCFDPIMQGRSGLVRAQGGFDPNMYQVAYTDYATATMAAFGTVAALLARDRDPDGRGQRVETSLLNNALAMQAGFFIDYPERPPDPPGAPDMRGTSAFRRAYECRGGWLFVCAADEAERRSLLQALDLTVGEPLPAEAPRDGALAERISTALRARELEAGIAKLRAAGVPAVPCTTFPAILEHPHLVANGCWWTGPHSELGEIVQTGEVIKLSATPMRLGPTAPALGEHSVEVLREVGFDDRTVAGWVAAGVVRQRGA
ncbi:MAG TPA: CoA transferase [Candidatus Bathyarchaeia archaeon]|nr:CoA transferase [Candidatus Bathyarchaeia archaeon]